MGNGTPQLLVCLGVCPYCGNEIAKTAILCIHCGTNLQTGRRAGGAGSVVGGTSSGGSEKRILPLFLLYFFCGNIGVHCFYAGKTGKGLFYLFGLVAIIGLFVSGVVGAEGVQTERAAGILVVLILVGLLWMIAWGICLLVDFFLVVTGNFKDGNGEKISKWT